MKILLLSPWFVKGTGGSLRLMTDVVRYLRQQKHDVTVLTYDSTNAHYSETPPDSSTSSTVFVPTHGRFAAPSRRMFAEAMRLQKQTQFDLIIGGVVYSIGVVAAFVSWRLRLPLVLFAYGEDVTCVAEQAVQKRFVQLALRQARRICAISHFTVGEVEKLGVAPEKISWLPPGIDATPYLQVAEDDVNRLRDRFALQNKRVILTLARLTPRKGHDVVLRALPAIVGQVPDVHYLVVGLGDPQPLRALAAREGVSDYLTIVPHVEESELAALFHLCDVHVMVSRRDEETNEVEGFGIVYLEAAASGKPSVAGSHGGCADAVMNNSTGLIVDPTSAEAVSDAVLHLLKHPEEAAEMGRRGRRRIQEEFDRDRLLQRFESLVVSLDSRTS